MDPINLALRADNEPPADAPVDGELSSAEIDGNFTALKEAAEQLDAEKLAKADAIDLDTENPEDVIDTLVPANYFLVGNADFDPEDPEGLPFYLLGWPDLLAIVLAEVPPTSPGNPVSVSHNGGEGGPVVGDTLTADFVNGWFGDVQWERDNTPISGATSTSYTLVEDDGSTYVAPSVSNLGFVAPGFNIPADGPTAPAAFVDADWTVAPGSEQYALDIDALPDDGGSAITALQAREDGGAPFALTGVGLGVRNITGKTGGVELAVQVRAVNAVGNGAWSTAKDVTPTSPGGPSWIAIGTAANIYEAAPSHPFAVPGGAQVGDMLILMLNNWDNPTGVTTNTGQTLTQLGVYSSGGELCRVFGVIITGSVPTTITATFSGSVQIAYQVLVARGVTAAGGLINNGVAFSPITTAPYTATVSSSLVLSMVSSQPTSTNMTAATINGADAATVTDAWDPGLHTVTGVNTSAAGARTMGLTFSAATTSGRWFSLELVP